MFFCFVVCVFADLALLVVAKYHTAATKTTKKITPSWTAALPIRLLPRLCPVRARRTPQRLSCSWWILATQVLPVGSHTICRVIFLLKEIKFLTEVNQF